ncbi:hypothetical protein M2093_001217 [Breznakia sp. PH1-1]|nr:hypothetical protein [Breznakia sp. PH1-1]MDH6404159.1 hypothetical protein [Breznakia sp. PF1-11]MDH6411956.1 hypothetical protein [Breznakia sp. PFB1-11]MDH6414147.1 hypothetical protein [Breznakia sp. PFB1-14]MDH6418900.1 hypothetical protein [Breznakia sp. PFB1-12]
MEKKKTVNIEDFDYLFDNDEFESHEGIEEVVDNENV